MYDSDRDGQLTRAEFNELIQDISSHVVQQQVEDSVKELELFGLTTTEEEMISFDDFQMVMEEHHILPSFATPHQKSDDSQIEAYRDLHAPERCGHHKTPLRVQALGF
jgi:Ca2+-binding EF-hand superfamily protein